MEKELSSLLLIYKHTCHTEKFATISNNKTLEIAPNNSHEQSIFANFEKHVVENVTPQKAAGESLATGENCIVP